MSVLSFINEQSRFYALSKSKFSTLVFLRWQNAFAYHIFWLPSQHLHLIFRPLVRNLLSAKPNTPNRIEKERTNMTNTKNGSNQGMVPEARAAMDRFKMEAAADLGVYSPQKLR